MCQQLTWLPRALGYSGSSASAVLRWPDWHGWLSPLETVALGTVLGVECPNLHPMLITPQRFFFPNSGWAREASLLHWDSSKLLMGGVVVVVVVGRCCSGVGGVAFWS